jgi:hypothetical protein
VKAATFTFLLAAAALVGCGGSLSTHDAGTGTGGTVVDASGVPPELRAQLEGAVATWAAAKSGCSTYSYDRRWMSVFGAGGSTAVEVQNDTPTRRRYSTNVADGGAVSAWTTVWEERGDQVGLHGPSGSFFPASTVEQLLAECVTVLARDPAAYTLRLILNEQGVPMTCTYFPVGCFDDCSGGITILTFGCAPLALAAGAH